MTSVLIILACILLPFVAAISFIIGIERICPAEQDENAWRSWALVAICTSLCIPAAIVYLAGWIQFKPAIYLVIGTQIFFVLACWIHSGNVIESFVVSAVVGILAALLSVEIIEAIDRQRRRREETSVEHSRQPTWTSAQRLIVLGALLLGAIGSNSARAGLSHPYSWERVSDDGQFVLVMVSPLPIHEDAVPHRPQAYDKIHRLRATYTQSGLYRNDVSTKPVWTMPYASATNVFLTTDGKYLVLADLDWRQSHGRVASFYASGGLLRRYNFLDLSQHYSWSARFLGGVNGRTLRLDDAQQTFTIATDQGETFVFDVTTGSMIRSSSRYPLYIGALLVILVGLAALVFGYYFRRAGMPSDAGVGTAR